MKLTKEQFLQQYGGDYGYNGRIDELRRSEFSRLKDSVYLDNAGTALHAESQVRKFFDDLTNVLFGNPHSQSPCSRQSTQEINTVRDEILQYFNTNSKEYSVIFTAGATAALKLVGECVPWSQDSEFSYLRESHNSVVGIRQYVLDKGGRFHTLSVDDVTQLLFSHTTKDTQNDVESIKNEPPIFSLFAFPAQCNFSGKKYPLSWIANWRQRHRHTKAQWLILLDAASYVSTATLDLSQYQPDFVPISFYKIFGFPTGIGALLVRNSIASILQKKYFGGGTVAVSLSAKPYQIFREGVSERFEDGTVDFLNIIALKYGFQMINSLGIHNITRHTNALIRYLYYRLSSLRHYNGRHVCVIYGNPQCDDVTQQGPILSFNLITSDNKFIGYAEVERLAALNNIHLRTGCFCNPGACQYYLGLLDDQIIRNHKEYGHVCWDQHDLVEGIPTGAVRVSLPYCCTFEDIEKFVGFIDENFVEKSPPLSLAAVSMSKSNMLTLVKIIVYPIKSCEGFEVSQWDIGVDGLCYDRGTVVTY
jgi:molybdenum cofactor sulfurtransferase